MARSAGRPRDSRSGLRIVGPAAVVLLCIAAAGVYLLRRGERDEVRSSDGTIPRPRLGLAGPERSDARPSSTGIRGRVVVDEGGLPDALVCATTSHAARRIPACASTKSDGTFEIELAAGAYVLAASRAGFVAADDPQTLRVSVRSGAWREVELHLVPGGIPLEGVVYDAAGGVVAGAWVRASPAFSHGVPVHGFSGEDGAFSLHLPAGIHGIEVVAEGYAPTDVLAPVPGPKVAVHLVPESVVEGRVVRADGTPVARAEVQAWATGAGSGFVEGAATADASGTFRLGGLLPGTYVLRATAEGACGATARPVAVGLGETARSDVPVAPCGRVVLAVVEAPSGAPCTAGGFVQRYASTGGSFATRPLDGSGRAVFEGVPIGTHVFSGSCGQRRIEGVTVAVEGPHTVERTVRVEGDAPGTLVVTVEDARGDPVFGAAVEVKAEDAAVTCCGTRTTDAEGIARVDRVVPGRYRVGAANAGAPVAVDVEPGARAEVALRLEGGTGTIAGEVRTRSGDPVASARGWLRSDVPGALGDARGFVTDERGRFVLEGVAPGTYGIAVEGRRVVEGGQVEVAAGPPPAEAAVIVEVGGCSARVVVRGPDGPVPDAVVALAGAFGWGGAAVRGISDGTGVVAFEALAAGTYRASASAPGLVQTDPAEVACEAGRAVQVAVDLAAAASLEGRIVPPCSGSVEVHPIPTTMDAIRRGTAGPDGAFHVAGIAPGRRSRLVVTACGRTASVELSPFAAGEARTGLSVETTPTADLEGRIVDRCGAPVAGVRVVPVGDVSVGRLLAREAVSDSDGRVRVRGVPAGGTVELALVGPGGGGRTTVEVPPEGGRVDVGALVFGHGPAVCDEAASP